MSAATHQDMSKRRIFMDNDYTIERLWKELDEGYQINYTYMEKRYVLTKLQKIKMLIEVVTYCGFKPHPTFY